MLILIPRVDEPPAVPLRAALSHDAICTSRLDGELTLDERCDLVRIICKYGRIRPHALVRVGAAESINGDGDWVLERAGREFNATHIVQVRFVRM